MVPDDDREAVSPALAAIGERLRLRREAAGRTPEDVEAATHVRAAYIRAIERGQAARMPAEVYVRGFLRVYADYLGLDGEATLQAYRAAQRAEEAGRAPGGPPPGRGRAAGERPAAPEAPPPRRLAPRERPVRPVLGPAAAPAARGAVPGGRARAAAGRRRPRARPQAGRGHGRRRARGLARWIAALAVAGLAGWSGFTLAGRWIVPRVRHLVSGAAGAPGAHRAAAAGTAATGTAAPPPGGASGPATTATTPAAQSPAGSAPPAAAASAAAGSARTVPAPHVVARSRHTAAGWVTTYTVRGAAGLRLSLTATGRLWTRRWVDGSSGYTDLLLLAGQGVHWRASRLLRVELGNTHCTIAVDGVSMPPLPTQDQYPEWIVVRSVPS